MKFLTASLLSTGMAAALLAQPPSPIQTGPKVGESIPSFEATDQNGRKYSAQSILGPKGTLLVFFRSADW
jgi:hypothetical protein